MAHQSLRDIDRSLMGARRERPASSSCDFCGANELARNVGYAGCIYCRRGGEWGSPIGVVELPEEEQRAVNKRWFESKIRKHGSLEAFFATGNFSDAFKAELFSEWEELKGNAV